MIRAICVLAQPLLTSVAAIAVVALGLPLAASASAAAAEKAPRRNMVFSIVRAGNPACEPDCPEWIAADGDIVADSADAFRAILTKAGDRNLPLLLNSLGGRVDVAVEMGRLIRQRAMTVQVARTDYLNCEPWDEKCAPDFQDGIYYGRANTSFGICNSACPLVLAGGVRRIASPLSRIGVHQTVTTQEKYRDIYRSTSRKLSDGTVVTEKEHVERQKFGTVTTREMTEALRQQLESYLISMDIKPALIDLMQSAPPEDIRYLNDAELKAFGVATEIHEIEPLVGYRICSSRSRAKNCVVRK